MPDRTLKLRELRRILRRYGIEEDASRAKGSHTVFSKMMPTGWASFPLPTSRDDVMVSDVRNARKRFGLTAEDGVTDDEFYGK